MSTALHTAASPVPLDRRIRPKTRAHGPGEGSPELQAALALATAEDLASGMTQVVASIRQASGAARVEWWARGHDETLDLMASDGAGLGKRQHIELGRAGMIVVYGGSPDPQLAAVLAPAITVVRRRLAEEQVARKAVELARRNESLEDFAALVAHELKSPLQAAVVVADDSSDCIEQALDLVDRLLETATHEASAGAWASVADCLESAVSDLPLSRPK